MAERKPWFEREIPLPSYIDWKPIATAPRNVFVLVACKSGYTTIDWVFRVAQFTAGYHDRWDSESNDALADAGHEPEYWAPLPNNPVP